MSTPTSTTGGGNGIGKAIKIVAGILAAVLVGVVLWNIVRAERYRTESNRSPVYNVPSDYQRPERPAPPPARVASAPREAEPRSIQEERERLRRRYEELKRHEEMAPHWEPVKPRPTP